MWSPLSMSVPGSSLAAVGRLSLISVDPWMAGVGNRGRLSFPNAVDALVDRSAGLSGSAFGLAVCSSSLAGFLANLNGLSMAFPLPAVSRLARRAVQLDTLDVSKMILVPHQLSGVGELLVNSLPAVRDLQRADLIMAASNAALTFATSDALGNFSDFQVAKANHVTMVSGVQAAAAAGFSGSVSGFRFFAEENMASALRVGHPGHDQAFCSIFLFCGASADLAFLREIFP